MKKFSIFIFCCLIAVASIHTLTQSHFFKKKMFAILNEKLNNSGIDVKIQNIESTYPEIILDLVTLDTANFVLQAKKIKAEISLLSLLKGKIVLSYLNIEDLDWQHQIKSNTEVSIKSINTSPSEFDIWIENLHISQVKVFDKTLGSLNGEIELKQSSEIPFNLKISGLAQLNSFILKDQESYNFSILITKNNYNSYQIDQFLINNDWVKIETIGSLHEDFSLEKAKIQIQTSYLKELSDLDIAGKLFATIELNGDNQTVNIQSRIPNLQIGNLSFTEVKTSLVGTINDAKLLGNLSLSAIYLNEKWDLATTVTGSSNSLNFPQIELSSSAGTILGLLEIKEKWILCKGDFSFNDLHKIYISCFGSAQGAFSFIKDKSSSSADFDCKIQNLFLGNFSSDNVLIYSQFQNPFDEKPLGTINCDFGHAKWNDLAFESALFETTLQEASSPFTLVAKGQWKHPLEIEMVGNFDNNKDQIQIVIASLIGSFYNHPLRLEKPCDIKIQDSSLAISPLELKLQKGMLNFSFKQNDSSIQTALKIVNFPCDFLSLNPLDIPVDGEFNLDASLSGSDSNLSGKCSATIQNLEMDVFSQTDPIEGFIALDASFSKNLLNGKFKFDVRQIPLMNFSFSIPIDLKILPFNYKILKEEPFFVRTYISGYLEDLLDFFDLGTNRIEGKCVCDLEFFNTINNPKTSGGLELFNGFYQNYYTGIELNNIYAKLQAHKNSLFLTQFSAFDIYKRNSITAKGKMDLNWDKLFPYNFNIDLNRFAFNGLDLATVDLSGKLDLKGDFAAGSLTGNLIINEGDILIPNKLPNLPPDLQVNYINAKKPLIEKAIKTSVNNPIELDITCSADDSIFISGFGVDSEWKGNLKIQGNTNDPKFIGQVDLIKGKFSFSGRNFILQKGSLRFTEKNQKTPFISVTGSINVKDVEILASINGPINNPQITFQSSPPMPLGSIASYLLFGQDIAEISSPQALELASALASVSGHSPSFFEETKKSLGVDRIQIITVADPSTESGEKMAIQVGKYVQEDVLVSYSQAAEYSAGDISIEITFKGGTSFVLESDQADEQKQGKFTFKWSKTY